MSNFRNYLETEAFSGVFQIKWEVVYGMGGQTRSGQKKQQSMFFFVICFYLMNSYFLWLVVSKSPSYYSVSTALHSIRAV